MAYTCPKCNGTGIYQPPSGAAVDPCPRCLGSKRLVEDSQGITVTYNGLTLGQLRSVSVESASVGVEDVTAMNAQVVQFQSVRGSSMHTGLVRQLIAGDLTPGRLSFAWIGKQSFTTAMLGSEATIQFQSTTLGSKTYQGFLVSYESQYEAGELAGGTATIQLVEL